jgi:hydrogenase large subunit
MTKRITIDPISRIEGHLRIDVEVDNGAVSKAWASATMWRGIERILQGRDPREAWLFTQRFCGVCTTVHAMASVRSVEDALKLEIPLNAQYIRNLILIAHALHDHIVHFYHLSALDWVDVMQIPKADPAKTSALAESLSPWTRNSKNEFKAAKDKVLAVAQSGQLGIFSNGYWGHPAMHLSPEVNLLAFSHYLQALEYQRKANQVVAMLGSKTPHIQNLTVGGVANAINFDSQGTLNMDRLGMIRTLLGEVIDFVQQVYVPDVTAIAGMYADWFKYGSGVTNYLAVPDLPLDTKGEKYDLPGGYISGGDVAGVKVFKTAADQSFRDAVTEDVAHSYYEGDKALHPWKGETNPEFTDWQADKKYSWVKAPRYNGAPAQVGPLAQVLVGYAQGHALTRKWADAALGRISAVAGRKVGVADLHSSLGRHGARAIRAAVLSDLALKHWELLVNNIGKGDTAIHNPPNFPSGSIEGVGTHEAPRGTLSHWVVVKNGKIDNYQAVVPTTWNASPRDEAGKPGPYEASLLNNPIANPELPLEVLRTVHSFDPCMACAVHTFDPEGNKIAKVKVL